MAADPGPYPIALERKEHTIQKQVRDSDVRADANGRTIALFGCTRMILR